MSDDYVLVEGAPATMEGRLAKEIRCYELLNRLAIPFWRCDHPDADANTMEACLKIDKILDATVCKNLFLCNRQHTKFYLLMMPGTLDYKAKELSAELGCSRLSFAKPEEMAQYLDITPGSVSILGLMNDHENQVQLLVDQEILEGEFCGCHPCINTSSLKLYTKDMFGPLLEAMHHDLIIVHLSKGGSC